MTDLKFVHITDTHLLNHSKETFHGLNTKESLETVLMNSQIHYPDVDFYLFTGDISQTGTKESYTLFKSMVQQLDSPVYCVPGNHDAPDLLQSIIPGCPINSIKIIDLNKFSLVLLNSWVKGEHYGTLSQKCLRQLEEHLRSNSKKLIVIAIHHPPALVNSKWLDDLGLQCQAEFLKILNKYSHDTVLVCGHVHQEVDKSLGRLRLLATPSTCHQFKVNSKTMHRIDASFPAYRFIQLKTMDNIQTKVHYIM